MKKHLVNIWYEVGNKNYSFIGMINELKGDNGKAIVYPCGIFKKVFGFSLPIGSRITIK